MLERLHPEIRVLSRAEGASKEQLAGLATRYPSIPKAFLGLFAEATELELSYRGIYLRFYGPEGCVEMDEAYSISEQVPGAIPVGDNGGGEAILVIPEGPTSGIHRADYSDLDPDALSYVAPSLEALLLEAAPLATAVGGCQAV